MNGKKCNKCKVWKCYSEYSKDVSRKDGYYYKCKECRKEYQKEYYKKNREKLAQQMREYYKQNKEKVIDRVKEHYKQNREEIAEIKRIYRENNKQKIAEYQKERYQNEPTYRLRCLVSVAVRDALSNNNSSKEGSSTWDALPYTPQQLREHLEAQFEEGMTWDNVGEWHIDHIYPQSLLPYESMSDDNFKLAWDLRNLRPLWAAENFSKGNKIIEGAEELLLEIKKELDISGEE